MINATLPHRGVDPWGNGSFGAPRGDHSHKGIDYACYPGTVIYSPVAGEITKVGYPYADNLSYKYVQVSVEGVRHRFFYVEPAVSVGDRVGYGAILGKAQNVAGRYDNRMKNHVHYEVLLSDGTPINPER